LRRGRSLPKIYNTTLHHPTPEQAAAGIGPARGGEIPLDADFESIRALAMRVAEEARASGADTLLVGGLSSFVIAVHEAAALAGLGVVEALTERILDERGRFVFVGKGLRIIREAGGGAPTEHSPQPLDRASVR